MYGDFGDDGLEGLFAVPDFDSAIVGDEGEACGEVGGPLDVVDLVHEIWGREDHLAGIVVYIPQSGCPIVRTRQEVVVGEGIAAHLIHRPMMSEERIQVLLRVSRTAPMDRPVVRRRKIDGGVFAREVDAEAASVGEHATLAGFALFGWVVFDLQAFEV